MSIADILETVQFVVDKQGQHTAVQMDITNWYALQQLIEDLEDMAELTQAIQEKGAITPWEDVVTEYEAKHGLTSDVSN